jgi:ATP-dependent Lhr-like helicase
LDKGWVDVDEALDTVMRATPFKNLTKAELEGVLNQLKLQGLLSRAEGKYKARRSGFQYYFSNLSMIPDTKRYRIRDMASRKGIGALDEEFVAAYAQPEATFVCKGETWKVVEVDHERSLILVEQFDDPLGAVPIWEGEMIPVPFEVAQEVGAMRGKIEEGLRAKKDAKEITAELGKTYPLSKEAASWIVDEISELVETGIPVPTDRTMLLETSSEYAILHACFGTLVNQTLAWILAELFSARIGASVQMRSDPYRIAFRFPERVKSDLVKETLEKLLPEHLESVLELTLRHSAMFQWRLMQVAKRFGAIRKDADLHRINVRRLVESFRGTPVFREAVRETKLEKLDVARAAEVLDSMHSGRISLQVVELAEPTVLAWPLLNRLTGGELVVPKRAEREILLAVKSRLERCQLRLHCLNCNEWTVTTRVSRLPEKIACRKCGAGLVTLLPREPKELLTLLKKHAREEKLGREERKKVERAYRIADLILTHGKRAVVVLSGRGIGPRAARKIVSREYREERDFYREILRAERVYARTRRFWT